MKSIEDLLSKKSKKALIRKKVWVRKLREMSELANKIEKDHVLVKSEKGDVKIDFSNDNIYQMFVKMIDKKLQETEIEIKKREMIDSAKMIINSANINETEKKYLTDEATKLILERFEGNVKGECSLPICSYPSDPNGRFSQQVDEYYLFASRKGDNMFIGYHVIRKSPSGKSKRKERKTLYKARIPVK